jgi:hypothetical protein
MGVEERVAMAEFAGGDEAALISAQPRLCII